ncbi:hypothetical protein ACTPC6_07155 [Clostridioides difficile]
MLLLYHKLEKICKVLTKDDGGIWNSFYIHDFREIQNNLDEVENIFFIEVD